MSSVVHDLFDAFFTGVRDYCFVTVEFEDYEYKEDGESFVMKEYKYTTTKSDVEDDEVREYMGAKFPGIKITNIMIN